MYNNCEICGLHKTCKNPFMKYTGKGELRILIVGEAPGKDEDLENEQFVGRCGRLFRKILNELNLDMNKHFWKTNCLKCRPINNQTPTDKQLDLCLFNLKKEINILKPKAILCVGGIALKNIIFRTFPILPKKGITKYHGEIYKSNRKGILLSSIFHPSYLIRQHNQKLIDETKNDIIKLIKKVKESEK